MRLKTSSSLNSIGTLLVRTTKGPKSKAKVILAFLSLFLLSFFLWFMLLILTKPHSSRNNNHQAEDETNVATELGIEDLENVEKQTLKVGGSRYLTAPKGYSPGLVITTSTNGPDRTSELSKVIAALCTGENAQLLARHRFRLYISVDALSDPGPRFSSSLTCSEAVKIIQRHHQSENAHSSTERIGAHYKNVMQFAFREHSHVIFLEDDLVPAHDFMSLFVPGSPAFSALEAHPRRVWCISAWNDMGVNTHASNVERLLRTDFFPGLGWLTTRRIWEDAIRRKWSDNPTTGWDNWLRSNNDEERDCVVPEVNRVKHVSTQGTNVNDPGNKVYGTMSFPVYQVNPTKWKLVGGDHESIYEHEERTRALAARRVDFFKNQADASNLRSSGTGDVLIIYERSSLKPLLKHLDAHPPMDEPRAAKRGLMALRKVKESDAFYFLCDLVRCAPRLFPSEKFVEKSAFILRAPKGKSCKEVCSAIGMRCDKLNMQTIAYPPGKACVIMRTYFDCSLGCSHQVGTELPAMATDKSVKTAGQCLTGESAVPDCESSHPSTRRLCSCIK